VNHPGDKRPRPSTRKDQKKNKSASILTGEGKSMAATITANKDNGFTVAGANAIVVRMTLFTPGMGDRTCIYSVEFPPAEGGNMGSTLTRDVPEKSTTMVVSSVLMTPKTYPLALFTNRRVSYTVDDSSGQRVVEVTIKATNTTGTNQQWHHEFALVSPGAGITFDVKKISGNMSIDSVDVTL
jgi:hypothetical protein